MRFNKIYLSLFIIIIFSACGSDDENNGDVLRYVQSGFAEGYTMVEKTSSGESKQTILLDTVIVDVDNAMSQSLPVFENFTNTTISFIDDNILISNNTRVEKNTCVFVNDTLYILNGKDSVFYGYKDQQRLIISQHYITHKRGRNYVILQGDPKSKLTKDDIVKDVFGSVANMTPQDTLICRTRNTVFE